MLSRTSLLTLLISQSVLVEMWERARLLPRSFSPERNQSRLLGVAKGVLSSLQPLPLLTLYLLLLLLQAALALLLSTWLLAPKAVRAVRTLASEWRTRALAIMLAASPEHPDVRRTPPLPPGREELCAPPSNEEAV